LGDSSAGLTGVLAGRYAIERELGRGGMATVYLATLAAVVSAPYLVFSSSSRIALVLLSIASGGLALFLCRWTVRVLRRQSLGEGGRGQGEG
jgi:hypothetical protein